MQDNIGEAVSKPEAAAMLREKERNIASDWNRVQALKTKASGTVKPTHLKMKSRIKPKLEPEPTATTTTTTTVEDNLKSWKGRALCKFYAKFNGKVKIELTS